MVEIKKDSTLEKKILDPSEVSISSGLYITSSKFDETLSYALQQAYKEIERHKKDTRIDPEILSHRMRI